MGDGDSFVDFLGQVLKPSANKAVDTLQLSLNGFGDRTFWCSRFFLFFELLESRVRATCDPALCLLAASPLQTAPVWRLLWTSIYLSPSAGCCLKPAATASMWLLFPSSAHSGWQNRKEREKREKKNLKRKKKRQKKCSENLTGLRSNVAQALPSGVREGAAIRNAGQEKAC